MNPPGTTTDSAVLRAEKRYIAVLAEEERLRHLHAAAVRESHIAVDALHLARATAWGSAEVSYEDAQGGASGAWVGAMIVYGRGWVGRERGDIRLNLTSRGGVPATLTLAEARSLRDALSAAISDEEQAQRTMPPVEMK